MSLALWAYFGLAALAANLPFMGERVFGLFTPQAGEPKAFAWRLLEMIALYAVVLGVGVWLESRFTPVHAKKVLDFYVPTFALFVIAAAPGFIIRYFWRKPGM